MTKTIKSCDICHCEFNINSFLHRQPLKVGLSINVKPIDLCNKCYAVVCDYLDFVKSKYYITNA